MSDICKVFDNLYMQWMCIWMCPNNIPAAPADKASGSHLVNKWWWSGVIEAVDPIKIDPTSMSDTCKVFDNLHMQWMWIWMCPYNNSAPLVDQALGIHLKNWVTPGQQMMVKCTDWGCRPNQDWSHITVCKVFDNLHMQWMCIWMCPYNIPAAPADQALGCHLEIWVTPGQQMMVKCGDWGCRPNQDWSHITVCKVFDNLHMQWMWIWMRPYNITAAPADQALGCHLEIWVTPGQQMMVKCSDWGCRPNQDWSHINVRHMQGVWHPSYAVDVNMDASLQHSSSPCWQSFGISHLEIWVTSGQQMMVKCSDWGCRPN